MVMAARATSPGLGVGEAVVGAAVRDQVGPWPVTSSKLHANVLGRGGIDLGAHRAVAGRYRDLPRPGDRLGDGLHVR